MATGTPTVRGEGGHLQGVQVCPQTPLAEVAFGAARDADRLVQAVPADRVGQKREVAHAPARPGARPILAIPISST